MQISKFYALKNEIRRLDNIVPCNLSFVSKDLFKETTWSKLQLPKTKWSNYFLKLRRRRNSVGGEAGKGEKKVGGESFSLVGAFDIVKSNLS